MTVELIWLIDDRKTDRRIMIQSGICFDGGESALWIRYQSLTPLEKWAEIFSLAKPRVGWRQGRSRMSIHLSVATSMRPTIFVWFPFWLPSTFRLETTHFTISTRSTKTLPERNDHTTAPTSRFTSQLSCEMWMAWLERNSLCLHLVLYSIDVS